MRKRRILDSLDEHRSMFCLWLLVFYCRCNEFCMYNTPSHESKFQSVVFPLYILSIIRCLTYSEIIYRLVNPQKSGKKAQSLSLKEKKFLSKISRNSVDFSKNFLDLSHSKIGTDGTSQSESGEDNDGCVSFHFSLRSLDGARLQSGQVQSSPQLQHGPHGHLYEQGTF